MKNIGRLFNTVKYLKPTQIYFRVFYSLRERFRKYSDFKYPYLVSPNTRKISLSPSIVSFSSNASYGIFSFLNKQHDFRGDINWNFSHFGKLWTYNLSYFDYLHQKGMSKEEGMFLIDDFLLKSPRLNKDVFEPFPISLRGINWIKFISLHDIESKLLNNNLYSQYKMLMDKIEYHLLGNHLLENGFSLLFASYYFNDLSFYTKANKILIKELKEQILDDGAHFELSPMYHQIMLFRVLDCINLVKNTSSPFSDEDNLHSLLNKTASKMLSWINIMTFRDGTIPLLNDSAEKIAPSTGDLNAYAESLGIRPFSYPNNSNLLSESGYRKITTPNSECIVDIGNVGPNYIPGHAHADTFNFVLHIDNNPFIVDTGTSTYEICDRRTEERSTRSHNTVTINNENSSHVWSGFRVAERARVLNVVESSKSITASHDGYKKKYGLILTRQWLFDQDSITITDTLSKESPAIFRLHFHPSVKKDIILSRIEFPPLSDHSFSTYSYSPEFNMYKNALCLEIKFNKELEIKIKL